MTMEILPSIVSVCTGRVGETLMDQIIYKPQQTVSTISTTVSSHQHFVYRAQLLTIAGSEEQWEAI